MTPGQYLKLRRQSAGLSIEDVAAMVHTSPRIGEIDRVAWIGRIEADVAALTADVVIALARVFAISRSVLLQLVDRRSYGPDAVALPPICFICGCTAFDPCFDRATNANCTRSAHDADTCSFCIEKDPAHA